MPTLHQVSSSFLSLSPVSLSFFNVRLGVSLSVCSSAKFSRKIAYVPDLASLSSLMPMDHVCIPDRVKQ